MDRFQPISQSENLCFLCLQPASNICDKCSIPYCNQEHYKVHYNADTDYCYPFRVLQKPEVGRYLVATRNIEPLELIIEDEPAIFGPNHDTVASCLECLLPVDGTYLCSKCDLPLCGPECENGPNHKPECQIFSKPLPSGRKFKVNFDRPIIEGQTKGVAPEYCCIAALRGLELKNNNPAMWNRLQLLMDHGDENKKSEMEYYEMFKINIVDFLIKVCGLDYTEEEVFRIIGIIRTNALHVEDPVMKLNQVSGRVVYPTLSYMSHSCICNARYRRLLRKKPKDKDNKIELKNALLQTCKFSAERSMSPSDHSIKVRAQSSIKKGEEISIQYLSFMFGQLRRKKTINSYWHFDCGCPRCQDPTELGSMLSAMKCSDCENGNLLPVNPMDLESIWKCGECDHQQSAQSVEDYINYCDDILFDTFENDVEKYEKLVQEFTQRLHPDHYIVMTVKKFLADLYGCTPGYQYNQLNEERLDKKISYYQNFLDTIGKVDPGYTKWRGQILYEVHRPKMIKANKAYESGDITKEEFVKTLKNIQMTLEESIQCLKPEADGTKEAHQGRLAAKAMAGIKELIFFSDFL